MKGSPFDGRFVARSSFEWARTGDAAFFRPDAPGKPRSYSTGVSRPPEAWALISSDFTEVKLLGWYEGIEHINLGDSGNPRIEITPFFKHSVVAFGGSPLRICIGNNERFKIMCYDGSGALRQIVRSQQPRRRVTELDIEQWKSWYRHRASPEETRHLDELPVPDSMPPYKHFVLDVHGNLWVEETRRLDEVQPVYTVFDTEGRFLSRLQGPTRFRAEEIGSDYVLGIAKDENSVEPCNSTG